MGSSYIEEVKVWQNSWRNCAESVIELERERERAPKEWMIAYIKLKEIETYHKRISLKSTVDLNTEG